MGKKSTEYSQIVKLLTDLKKEYPNCRLAQHLYLALEEYEHLSSLWNMSDKELLFALEKHQVTTLLHNPVTPRTHWDKLTSDEDIDRIVKDAQNLDTIFEDEEDDYE